MNQSANKGEWSELYAFLRLLSQGVLYSGDGDLHTQKDKFYPILKVFRNDAPDRYAYIVDRARKQILVTGTTEEFSIPQSVFTEQSDLLLSFIQKLKGTSQTYTSIENFLDEIRVESIKAKSSDKADIRIMIHDLRTGTSPELGYSIKSRLGGSSTLINSSVDATNFVYSVPNISSAIVSEFNSLDRFKKKFELLKSKGVKVEWEGLASRTFYNNLMMLDACLPWLLGECLLYYYSGQAHTMEEVELILRRDNPLNFDIKFQPKYYEYKLKQFLLAFALGMTAGTSWNGKFNANGGYIVVKEDGDIICYHFFDRNELEDYLFKNTYFDTPSTARHKFGHIYKIDTGYNLKLNLQVRFI